MTADDGKLGWFQCRFPGCAASYQLVQHRGRHESMVHGMKTTQRVNKGYIMRKADGHPRAESSHGYVLDHILVAERALGKHIPQRHPIHHVDEDRANNTNSNLVICESKSYHLLLHTRMRIKRSGGNPDIDKLCSICRALLSRHEFGANRSMPDGLSHECKQCHNTRSGRLLPARREYKNARQRAAYALKMQARREA